MFNKKFIVLSAFQSFFSKYMLPITMDKAQRKSWRQNKYDKLISWFCNHFWLLDSPKLCFIAKLKVARKNIGHDNSSRYSSQWVK